MGCLDKRLLVSNDSLSDSTDLRALKMPVTWEYVNNVLKLNGAIGESFSIDTISGIDSSSITSGIAFRHSKYANSESIALPSDAGRYVMEVYSYSFGARVVLLIDVIIGGAPLTHVGPVTVVLYPTQITPHIHSDNVSYVFYLFLFFTIAFAFIFYSWYQWQHIHHML